MNSPFMRVEAEALAAAVKPETGRQGEGCAACIAKCCRAIPARKNSIWRSAIWRRATIEQYAQVLLSSNEEIFWQ